MIKLIASDIDETIAPEGSTSLNPQYFEIIKAFQDKGVHFIAVSGRHRHSIEKTFAEAENIDMLGNNGTDIHCKDFIYSMDLSDEDYQNLIKDLYALPEGYQTMVCNAEMTYIDEKDKDFYDLMSESYGYECKLVPDLSVIKGIAKISVFNKNGVEDDIVSMMQEKWQGCMDVCKVGKLFLDFVGKGCNKGKAIEIVQKHYGVSPEETVVFGDSDNDYPMFLQAKYSYAVAGASSKLKSAATEVIGDVTEDAVLAKLKEIYTAMES